MTLPAFSRGQLGWVSHSTCTWSRATLNWQPASSSTGTHARSTSSTDAIVDETCSFHPWRGGAATFLAWAQVSSTCTVPPLGPSCDELLEDSREGEVGAVRATADSRLVEHCDSGGVHRSLHVGQHPGAGYDL